MLKICTTKVRKFCVCEMKKYNEIDLTFNISANGEELIAFLKQNKHSSHTGEIKQRCE